jgi:hypothetical protein
MGYAPNPIDPTLFNVVRKPALGGEQRLYIAYGDITLAGTVEITAKDTCQWTPNPEGVLDPLAGQLLVARIKSNTGVNAGAAGGLQLSVEGEDPTANPVTGEAKFAVPGYSMSADQVFPVSWTVDVLDAANTPYSNITDVTCIAATESIGAEIEIIGMPPLSAFTKVDGKNTLRFPSKASMPLSIPNEMDGTYWQKPGRSQESTFTLEMRHIGAADGVAKYDGMPVVLQIDTRKEATVVTERIFLTGARYATEINSPDGDPEVAATANGVFQLALVMPAPTA